MCKTNVLGWKKSDCSDMGATNLNSKGPTDFGL